MPFPQAFTNRISQQLGTEKEAFFSALQKEPKIAVRLNQQKIADIMATDFQNYSPIPWQKSAYYLAERPSFTYDPLFHAGAYYVQEPSSMLISQFLEPENYKVALDLCAAPGGKSSLLISELTKDSVLIANEVIRTRAAILAENLARWGYPNCIVTQNDPKDFAKLPPLFDLMLIDAPCSGEGMFRKDTASINEWSEENVATCAARQQRIVASVLPALKQGGHIIYSTCTYSYSENEELITWLLATFEDLELYPYELNANYGAEPVTINDIANAAYRCYPHKLEGEGFFVCRLRKKGVHEEEEEDFSEKKQKKGKPQQKEKTNKPKFSIDVKQIAAYINDFEEENVEIFDDNVFYYLPQIKQLLPQLKGLNFLKKGLLIGKIQGKDFTPSHELALSTLLSKNCVQIDLDKETALRYLQKNDLDIQGEIPEVKGKNWLLAAYKGVSLGWMKAVGNRFKNHFPINWRIRN